MKKLRVIYLEVDIEETITRSSPLKTISKAMEKEGTVSTFIDPYKISAIDFIKTLVKNDVVMFLHYIEIPRFLRRQIALASFFKCPVVRYWAGTDALNAVSLPDVTKSVKESDQYVTLNITTSHQGIVDELASIGLNCTSVPKVIDSYPTITSLPETRPPAGVVAYLPSNRLEFYGVEYVKALINKYSQITFYIVADDEHTLAHHSNVESLGWIQSMDDIWDKIGVLVRITEHDGFPRMILEALARGKYVIHNRHFEGVWKADTQEEIEEHIDSFLQLEKFNKAGIDAVKNLQNSSPATILYDTVSQTRVLLKEQWVSMKLLIAYSIFK